MDPCLRFCASRVLILRKARPSLRLSFRCRYATHHQRPPSLLQNAVKQKAREAIRQGSAGPFQWGVSHSFDQDEKVPKWEQLSAGGKVLRTTTRTANLTVILLGAGISALLIYSLVSELFSKNSPSVLYDAACEKIKDSPRVTRCFHGPPSFHKQPPSAVRPRHRDRHRHAFYHVMTDSKGREHMILHFYVHASESASHNGSKEHLGSIVDWARDAAASASDLTLDQSIDWTKAQAADLLKQFKNVFRFLIGRPLASPSPVPPEAPPSDIQDDSTKSKSGRALWGLIDVFGGFKRNVRQSDSMRESDSGVTYSEGEVHADLIRNNEGYFIFRYLFVDFPSSQHRQERLWLLRAD